MTHCSLKRVVSGFSKLDFQSCVRYEELVPKHAKAPVWIGTMVWEIKVFHRVSPIDLNETHSQTWPLNYSVVFPSLPSQTLLLSEKGEKKS